MSDASSLKGRVHACQSPSRSERSHSSLSFRTSGCRDATTPTRRVRILNSPSGPRNRRTVAAVRR